MNALTVTESGSRRDPVTLVAVVLAAVGELTGHADGTFAPAWTWDERSRVIGAVDRAVELLSVYRSRLLAAHKADGRWSRAGDRSFESYRGRTTGTGPGAARTEMELAEGLTALPETARAVQDGDVSLAHALVLARLRARSSRGVRDALDAGGATRLLSTASGVDAPTFAKRAAAWAAAQDVDAAERSFDAVRARRYGRISDRDGGTKIDAFIDPVAGASLRTALEAVTAAPGPADERTSEQRTADAMAALAERILEVGTEKIGAQIRPHLSLVVPAATWTAVRDRRTQSTAGQGDDAAEEGTTEAKVSACRADDAAVGATRPVRACALVLPELDDGTAIPLSALARIACDCELTRIVLDAEGVPLDVGRTQRTYAKEIRRAVLIRDGHCQWPGCTLRAAWCEVHHLRPYSQGGSTSVANALTLCVHHHHEVHRRHVAVTGADHGHTFARSDGTMIGATSRDQGVLRMLEPGDGDPPGGVNEGPCADAAPARRSPHSFDHHSPGAAPVAIESNDRTRCQGAARPRTANEQEGGQPMTASGRPLHPGGRSSAQGRRPGPSSARAPTSEEGLF